MRILNSITVAAFLIAALLLCGALDARAEDTKPLSIASLLGKYEGTMQVHRTFTFESPYQTEIVSLDTKAKTLSLVAHCEKCDVKDWKRNKCTITEENEKITFVCKTNTSDEVYTFNGSNLKATGSGKQYPYSISVTKVAN